MAGFNAALENLYRSVLEPDLLDSFLEQICRLTGSTLGAVMSHDLSHSQGSVYVVHGADGFDLSRYEREYASENLWFLRSAHAMRTGAIINTDDFVSRREFRGSRYYQDVLHQFDRTEQGLALCADMDDGRAVVMAFNRSGRLPAFTDAQLNLFRELLPHWQNAYALQRRLSWLESHTASMEAALDRMNKAMFLFDSRGHLAKTNAPAESMLRCGNLMVIKGETLNARDPSSGLNSSIATACGVGNTSNDGRSSRRQSRLLLRNREGQAMAVANLHPLPPRGEVGGYAAVMFVQELGVPSSPNGAEVLKTLFGVTDAEAKLAIAMHFQGNLEKAAEMLGITAGSARTRLKVLFEKMGVRNQAAVLRLLDAVIA